MFPTKCASHQTVNAESDCFQLHALVVAAELPSTAGGDKPMRHNEILRELIGADANGQEGHRTTTLAKHPRERKHGVMVGALCDAWMANSKPHILRYEYNIYTFIYIYINVYSTEAGDGKIQTDCTTMLVQLCCAYIYMCI